MVLFKGLFKKPGQPPEGYTGPGSGQAGVGPHVHNFNEPVEGLVQVEVDAAKPTKWARVYQCACGERQIEVLNI